MNYQKVYTIQLVSMNYYVSTMCIYNLYVFTQYTCIYGFVGVFMDDYVYVYNVYLWMITCIQRVSNDNYVYELCIYVYNVSLDCGVYT